MAVRGKETSSKISIADMTDEEVIQKLIQCMTSDLNVAKLNMMERGELTKEAFEQVVKDVISSTFIVNEDQIDYIYDNYDKRLNHYYPIDELIEDPDVSDIRLLKENLVYYKKLGKRYKSEVRFSDRNGYNKFISRVILKNRVNAGIQNAMQRFADVSLEDWILRFDLSTEYLLDSKCPMLHIRKISKEKKLFPELIEEGLLTQELADIIEQKILNGESFFLCGHGGSGKTTLLNGMLEIVPDDRSICGVQEIPEIFSQREREFYSYHVINSKGDSQVSYDLAEIASNGLVNDTDVFIIGEIKGDEARDFLSAAYSGTICWGTGHANSVKDATKRLADLIKRTSDYTVKEIEYMLKDLDNIIYLRRYQAMELAELSWDESKDRLQYNTVYRRK